MMKDENLDSEINKLKEKKGAPELRFKGFLDAWEQRKLGETNSFFTDGNYGESYPSTEELSDKMNGVPFLRGSNLKDGRLVEDDANYITPEKHEELTSGHLEFDDIVLAVRGSLGALGYAKQENVGWNINSQLAIIRTDKSELDGQFLIQYLLSSKGQKELLSRNTGTALKQLPIKQLKDVPVPIPKTEEQRKIGSFFTQLDNTITLHQRKLDKLKQLKQGYLQQLFPQNGEKFPRVRFINFEAEWKERKLGNIGKVQSGVGFPETEQGGTQGIPFYKVSDMNNLGNETEMKNSNNYVNTEQIMRKKWKPVETVPAIIFAKVGAAIMLNRKRLVKHSFLIDNNTMAYIFYDSWDIKFGKTVFETINLPRYAQVGALPSYNGFDIESIVIKIPNISEQEKIGSFFKELDSYIILHQNKLNQLKTCKKALLQKIFI